MSTLMRGLTGTTLCTTIIEMADSRLQLIDALSKAGLGFVAMMLLGYLMWSQQEQAGKMNDRVIEVMEKQTNVLESQSAIQTEQLNTSRELSAHFKEILKHKHES